MIGVRSLNDSDIYLSSENQILAVSLPGEDILTTLPKGTYDFVSGSSLATAHASGLAALLLQLKHSLTKEELFNLLVKANEPDFDALFSEDLKSNIGKIRSKADKRI